METESKQKNKIAIVGAGLAGLNCARLLESDFEVSLFDKNGQVGGRILSSHENGYILDHGFQVFLPDYPEAKTAFDYQKLQLNEFTPGALIRINGKFHKFSDPIRQPLDTFSTLLAPIGNFKDKLLILKLKSAVKKLKPELKNISTLNYLQDFGFSEGIINKFFKPFFSGVFLERELKTSAYFFSFLFDLFSNCKATVPLNGMMELPLNLLNQLNKTKLVLNTDVTKFTSKSLFINSEEHVFDHVICAYDHQSNEFNSVTTDYFESDDALASTPTLYLNGNKTGVINHIAPMSVANSQYSPSGKFLWSVNSLISSQDATVQAVGSELHQWFKGAHFKHIKRFHIKKALPSCPQFGKKAIFSDGIYYCGDHMQDPSINGALKSGRLVAEKILSKESL